VNSKSAAAQISDGFSFLPRARRAHDLRNHFSMPRALYLTVRSPPTFFLNGRPRRRDSCSTESPSLAAACSTVRSVSASGSHVGTSWGAPIQAVEQKAVPHPHLITNSFRITFGAVVLTLRRFEDDWSRYICHLLPNKDQRPAEAKSLFQEIKDRKLDDAANLLVAHSAPKNQAPLSTPERLQIIIDAGWQTEEELVAWYPSVALRLLAVRDAVAKEWPDAKEGAKAAP